MTAPKTTPGKQPTWLESLLITSIGWIPLSPGRILRRLLYRQIFARVGDRTDIQPNVEFAMTQGIELGYSVQLHRYVRIRSIGQGSRIHLHDYAHLDRGVDIKTHRQGFIEVGENTYIGPYTCLSGDSIRIGKNCMIASHSGIYANNHNFADPHRPICQQGNSYKGIVIEEDSWLGSGVRVLDGVTIGRGSVVGSGAVVTKSLPPYSIAVGVPAKVIGRRGESQAAAQAVEAEVHHVIAATQS